MERCSRCGIPKINTENYGTFISMLYDFYQAVKTTKESNDENEKFIANIEVEFLLQQLSDVNQIDDF